MTILLIIAGFGAGVVTGLAGASAAAVITPLLITFSPTTAYMAITISLLTDFTASLTSAITYYRHGNVKVKEGLWYMLTCCIFSMLGGWLSIYINDDILKILSTVMTALLAISFIRHFAKSHRNKRKNKSSTPITELFNIGPIRQHPRATAAVCGVFTGLICGFIGTGGGLAMIIVLQLALGFDTKSALGTSVLIMTASALVSGISHSLAMGFFPTQQVIITSIAAIIGARIAAQIGNTISEKALQITMGVIFSSLAILMLYQRIF